LRTRRGQSWPLLGPLESLGTELIRKTGLFLAIGCIIDDGQEAKVEILGQTAPQQAVGSITDTAQDDKTEILGLLPPRCPEAKVEIPDCMEQAS